VDLLIVLISRALTGLSRDRIDLRRYYLFSQPLQSIPSLPSRRGANISIRKIDPDDPVTAGFPRPADQVAARFAAGAECYVAEVDQELAGFLWFVAGRWDDPESDVMYQPHPPANSVWDFDVFVAEQHRLSFVFYKLWSEVAEALIDRGIDQSASLVWTHNEDSVRSHVRLGAFPVGSALHIKLGQSVLHIADRTPRVRFLKTNDESPCFDVFTGENARRQYLRFRKRS